jgi:hypothetical protein
MLKLAPMTHVSDTFHLSPGTIVNVVSDVGPGVSRIVSTPGSSGSGHVARAVDPAAEQLGQDRDPATRRDADERDARHVLRQTCAACE